LLAENGAPLGLNAWRWTHCHIYKTGSLQGAR